MILSHIKFNNQEIQHLLRTYRLSPLSGFLLFPSPHHALGHPAPSQCVVPCLGLALPLQQGPWLTPSPAVTLPPPGSPRLTPVFLLTHLGHGCLAPFLKHSCDTAILRSSFGSSLGLRLAVTPISAFPTLSAFSSPSLYTSQAGHAKHALALPRPHLLCPLKSHEIQLLAQMSLLPGSLPQAPQTESNFSSSIYLLLLLSQCCRGVGLLYTFFPPFPELRQLTG